MQPTLPSMPVEQYKADCLVCGQALVSGQEFQVLTCFFCGKQAEVRVWCPSGHFVCNACQSTSAMDLIETVTLQSISTDPIGLAVDLMRSPKVKMHGPEHHFLVSAVLLSAFYNQTGGADEKPSRIQKARHHTEEVWGSFCGFSGACGAGAGTGIYVGVVTDATPLSKDAWNLSNLMTSGCLESIAALGGPRCCKRDTFLALRTALRFTQQHFDVRLRAHGPVLCEFSSYRRECFDQACPFHATENFQ